MNVLAIAFAEHAAATQRASAKALRGKDDPPTITFAAAVQMMPHALRRKKTQPAITSRKAVQDQQTIQKSRTTNQSPEPLFIRTGGVVNVANNTKKSYFDTLLEEAQLNIMQRAYTHSRESSRRRTNSSRQTQRTTAQKQQQQQQQQLNTENLRSSDMHPGSKNGTLRRTIAVNLRANSSTGALSSSAQTPANIFTEQNLATRLAELRRTPNAMLAGDRRAQPKTTTFFNGISTPLRNSATKKGSQLRKFNKNMLEGVIQQDSARNSPLDMRGIVTYLKSSAQETRPERKKIDQLVLNVIVDLSLLARDTLAKSAYVHQIQELGARGKLGELLLKNNGTEARTNVGRQDFYNVLYVRQVVKDENSVYKMEEKLDLEFLQQLKLFQLGLHNTVQRKKMLQLREMEKEFAEQRRAVRALEGQLAEKRQSVAFLSRKRLFPDQLLAYRNFLRDSRIQEAEQTHLSKQSLQQTTTARLLPTHDWQRTRGLLMQSIDAPPLGGVALSVYEFEKKLGFCDQIPHTTRLYAKLLGNTAYNVQNEENNSPEEDAN